MGKPLKVGLLVDSTAVGKTTYDLIEASVHSPEFEVSALIVLDQELSSASQPAGRIISFFRKNGVRGVLEALMLKTIIALESFFLLQNRELKDELRVHDISEFSTEKIVIKPSVSKSGLVLRVEDDIEKLGLWNSTCW